MANYNDSFPADSNDLYWEINGVTSGNGEADVGYDTSYSASEKGGFRFGSIALPASASIQAATLRMIPYSRTGTQQISFIIRGVKEADTASYAGPSSPFGRTQTTASATGTYDSSGLVTTNIDVKSIVQEITTAGGWSSGNHMGLTIDDNGTTHLSGTQEVWFSSAVLSILVSANPSFVPTTTPIRVPSLPPKQNYGILASHVGFDVRDPNQQHQEFSSRARVLKLQKTEQLGFGSPYTATVSHGLKYPPAFLTYFFKGGRTYLAPRNSHGTSEALNNGFVYTLATAENISFYTGSSFDIADLGVTAWTYYVFIDENL